MMSKTHKMSRTRQYRIWKGIKRRCLNKNEPSYKNYGGRGIRLCDRWNSFESFWEDMRNGYADDLMIDRVNNDGDYCKENCRWVDSRTQNSNKRNNVFYVVEGKKMILWEISEKYGIPYKRLRARIELLGKTVGDAVSMGKNTPRYYYLDKKRKKFVVEVTKFGKKIYGGMFNREIDARKSVKEIIDKFLLGSKQKDSVNNSN